MSLTAQEKEPILEISWNVLHCRFPWACFLAEGGAKKVHKVYNSTVKAEEALSVMYVCRICCALCVYLDGFSLNFGKTLILQNFFRDTHGIDNVQIVANELAISAMASSLVRQGVCPNFVAMHRVFTCAYAPPKSHWGDDANKFPKGVRYEKNTSRCTLKEPKRPVPGRYQYIQMELVNEGDAEELIKRQHCELLPTEIKSCVLYQ